MSEIEANDQGYVYILEVKDIDLPVCKIGMTTRNPYERCNEINKSSTGDFIWEVAHYIAVDNCKKLESLVHSKLAPLRQKRREFFNINADDANTALLSIFTRQREIKKLNTEAIIPSRYASSSKKKKAGHTRIFKRIDSEYTELLQLFSTLLGVKGRPFGQLNKPNFGMSDGNEGVQWNLSVFPDSTDIRLGVNLEGMKYKNWPISKFIQSEISIPKITDVAAKLHNPENIVINFTRDAWQVTARPTIAEKYLGGKACTFAEIDQDHWTLTLAEALACLSKRANYCGRAKQRVTLESMSRDEKQVRIMDVSPHLTIWSRISLEGDLEHNIESKIAELQPIYDWVEKASQS
jgi:hypothetical protein